MSKTDLQDIITEELERLWCCGCGDPEVWSAQIVDRIREEMKRVED